MRSKAVTAAFCLSAAVALGGMNGTYTIKPAGGGDFLALYAAGEAIDSLGMSGNCVFEIYGDTLYAEFSASYVEGSDSWTTTFRPGPGANPVLLRGGVFTGGSAYHNVKVESLRFERVRVTLGNVSGWRISGCQFAAVVDWAVKMEGCTSDTVDGCAFDVVQWASGEPTLQVENGNGNVMFNNVVNCESSGVRALVYLVQARNTRFIFNTLRWSPWGVADGSCIEIMEEVPCEVCNNVFVLTRASGASNACVGVSSPVLDSIGLDNNCYFVESLGYVGGRPFEPYLYNWSEWRGFGFEPNGINADPRFVSSTDLHLRPGSPCNQRATPIAGISFDIDGDPRDPAHPDMGADEIAGDPVEESLKPQASSRKQEPTILSGASGVKRLASSLVFDAMGRRVQSPRSGVFFVWEAQAQAQAQSIRKVVMTR